MNTHCLTSAVRYVEGLHFREAVEQLHDVLKGDAHNAVAWFWYSRVITDAEKIRKALTYALHLDPSDIRIKQETMRFRHASKQLTDAAISRCPFCWVPLNSDRGVCVYCNSALSIHPGKQGKQETRPIRSVLRRAQKRYQRVISEDQNNAKAHYYLGLASFNLGHQRQAIENLHRAETSAPEAPFFAEQRSMLQHLLLPGDELPADTATAARNITFDRQVDRADDLQSRGQCGH